MYLCYFLLEVVNSPQQGLKGHFIWWLHGLVLAHQVRGCWLHMDGADFVLGSLLPSLTSLSGDTGVSKRQFSWSCFLPRFRHFYTGYLPFLLGLS